MDPEVASSPAVLVDSEHSLPSLPTPALLAVHLSSNSKDTEDQKRALVAHALNRACLFGDQGLITFLLHDPAARALVNLDVQDEDGVSLVSLTIQGFTPTLESEESDNERDVEREECVRLLVQQGADIKTGDLLGWTPLHYAALHAPPTLVLYLSTHGCSPLSKSLKGLTPLDIVTGYDVIPGREDVALVLEESMRASGWTGNARNQIKEMKIQEEAARSARRAQRRNEWSETGRLLGLADQWWEGRRQGEGQMPRIYLTAQDAELAYQEEEEDANGVSNYEDLDEDEDDPTGEYIDSILSPPISGCDILIYSPINLPRIFYAIIDQAKPVVYPLHQRAMPANALYGLVRFAAAHANDEWLDDLVSGAATRIEETIRARKFDMSHLAFWLFNVTTLLHFVRCDRVADEKCIAIDADMILEDLINAIFVYVVRGVEQSIDEKLDTCFIEHAPLASEFNSIQFEGEWSFFKSLTPKKRQQPPSPYGLFNQASSDGAVSPQGSPKPDSRSESPAPGGPSPGMKAFSLRNTLTRKQVVSAVSSLNGNANADSGATGNRTNMDVAPPIIMGPQPTDVTALLGGAHTLLTLYGVNPTLTVQLFSQVLSWAACEIFNRILTRKKYLCRSRAMQINMNISAIEEWAITDAGLPKGVVSHFSAVKELLRWLQLLSSIQEFPNLVATIQTFKSLNPLQMRRAVRDYRYEKNEGRMDEECAQYLLQVQKDWERQRVQQGVAAVRQDFSVRDRDWDGSVNSDNERELPPSDEDRIYEAAQQQIDALFDRDRSKSDWLPAAVPEPLGELLDSRHMLPLILPSDPILLAAMPMKYARGKHEATDSEGRPMSRASQASSGATDSMAWRTRLSAIRDVRVNLLDIVDYGWFSERRWSTKVYQDETRSEVVSPADSPQRVRRSTSRGADEDEDEDEDEDDDEGEEDGDPADLDGKRGRYPTWLTPNPPKRKVSDRHRNFTIKRARESTGGETIRPDNAQREEYSDEEQVSSPAHIQTPTTSTKNLEPVQE
ncbi:positive myosin-light-chain-phosphatase [Rhizoctonia solani]|uniref:Positive myosin-light-chain-phosphatase n=1 Tax=Rhizoctonia solani TaxID=456999 RepID=A0A8H7HCR6_9AGAM|nr:positive myosin-light-chain-phosphatase [Rhizoctonia solani]